MVVLLRSVGGAEQQTATVRVLLLKLWGSRVRLCICTCTSSVGVAGEGKWLKAEQENQQSQINLSLVSCLSHQ